MCIKLLTPILFPLNYMFAGIKMDAKNSLQITRIESVAYDDDGRAKRTGRKNSL